MPELPEVTARSIEMKNTLVKKVIQHIEVLQPKSLNVPEETFVRELTGATIVDVSSCGKWIFIETTQGWLLLNLGMGGEILLTAEDALPQKRRLSLRFTDDTYLSINFWWFGYAHYVPIGALSEHKMTARLGPQALELTADDLKRIVTGRRAQVKSFLLDQSSIAGIGNAYVHDILFLAGLHPLRTLNTLSEQETEKLAEAIHAGLQPSLEKGGAFYEVNLYGEKGGFTAEDILVGYREGEACPVCATTIVKIKTGSTSSFICPTCQPLEPD